MLKFLQKIDSNINFRLLCFRLRKQSIVISHNRAINVNLMEYFVVNIQDFDKNYLEITNTGMQQLHRAI